MVFVCVRACVCVCVCVRGPLKVQHVSKVVDSWVTEER